MRKIIFVCLADGDGCARYRKLTEYLRAMFMEQKTSEKGFQGARFLCNLEEMEILLHLPDPDETAVIFVISVDRTGINLALDGILKRIALVPGCLEGASFGMIVSANEELYTKEIARKAAFVLNQAGAVIPGGAFAEATESMQNLKTKAALRKLSLEETFFVCAKEAVMAAAYASFSKKRIRYLTCIHSSIIEKSNTYAYWKLIRENLSGENAPVEIQEINLYGKELPDCRGCSYQACQKYGEKKTCFFGGVMAEEVYPAIEKSDAVILLCPNYNDAIGANLTACINRLTALYRNSDFSGKYLYIVVVSGYSGSGLVAEQVIDAMVLNKGFTLPGYAVEMKMANHPGELLREPYIQESADEFARRINRYS